MNIVIYGAQAIALGAYKAIKELTPDRDILCFLVTEMGINAPVLGGKSVRELKEFASSLSSEEKDNIEVLIATPDTVMEAIENSLDAEGLFRHVRLDSLRWAQMQQMAFAKNGKFMPLAAYSIGTDITKVSVYKAKFFKDKELSTPFVNPKYMHDLQVGTERTDVRVAKLLDNQGDNISHKNGNYSELTGLYWIWKNRLEISVPDADEYVGLAHYRRMFDISEDDLRRIKANDIDVLLPYPMPYEPCIEAHPKRYLKEVDWQALLTALEELQPEYAKAFKDILKGQYMYNYNIIIARKEVLQDYCSWLFPILERTEELSEPKGCERADRYIGYMGEILETLYFMYNKDKLTIAHAGCRFLV